MTSVSLWKPPTLATFATFGVAERSQLRADSVSFAATLTSCEKCSGAMMASGSDGSSSCQGQWFQGFPSVEWVSRSIHFSRENLWQRRCLFFQPLQVRYILIIGKRPDPLWLEVLMTRIAWRFQVMLRTNFHCPQVYCRYL